MSNEVICPRPKHGYQISKPECQNVPKIYQETTWLLFQMKCKDKHAEELQGSYEQPSGGGPDKDRQRGGKKKKIQREKEATGA